MLSLLTGRTYIIIAVVVAGMLYLLSLIDPGGSIAGFFSGVGAQASAAGLPSQMVNFVIFPLEFAFSGEIAGVILGGLLWPLGLVWLLLLVLLVVAGFILPLIGEFNAAL